MRAERSGSAKDWTPVEMLEDLLREAKDGTLDLTEAVIVFNHPVNEQDVSIRRAGVDPGTEFVMIKAAMKMVSGLTD